MIRKLVRVLLVLLVLLLVTAGVLWIYIDRVAAKVLTEGVKYAGGAPCTVEAVDVSLVAGSIEVTGLTIGNPDGFKAGVMFTLGEAAMEIDVTSLWDQPVHVRRLAVTAPLVRITGKAGRTNVAVFIENVRKTLGADEPLLLVDKLVIEGAKVEVAGGMNGQSLVDVELARFELEKVHGDDGKGVTVGELMARILLECTRRGALKAKLNLDSLLPKEILKGLGIISKPLSSVLQGTGSMLTSPWRVLLGSPTAPASQPHSRPAPRE